MGRFLQLNIHLVIAKSMQDNYDFVEDLQREQLAAGETSTGAEIKPFYKPITILIKKKKGQPTDKVTLKDEGGFYKGIRAKPDGNGDTDITSTDPKTPDLIKKYTATIFGLSVPRQEQLRKRLRPTIQDNFRQEFEKW